MSMFCNHFLLVVNRCNSIRCKYPCVVTFILNNRISTKSTLTRNKPAWSSQFMKISRSVMNYIWIMIFINNFSCHRCFSRTVEKTASCFLLFSDIRKSRCYKHFSARVVFVFLTFRFSNSERYQLTVAFWVDVLHALTISWKFVVLHINKDVFFSVARKQLMLCGGKYWSSNHPISAQVRINRTGPKLLVK